MESWLRLALHLKMGIDECMEKHNSSDLPLWMVYLDKLETIPTKDQYYLAQIAQQIVRANVKKPEDVKIEHLLLNFVKDTNEVEEDTDPELATLEELEKKREVSINNWLMSLGMKSKDGKPVQLASFQKPDPSAEQTRRRKSLVTLNGRNPRT